MNAKTHLYAILEKAEEGDRLSRTVDLFIIILIVLNVTMVILETVAGINETYGEFIEFFETVCVLIFTVEYLMRIWCCTADEKFAHALKGRLAFMLTPLALIDFIAIFPYYVFLLVTIPPDYTLPLRLLRLFRLLKVGRYSHSMQMFGRVIWEKRRELYLVAFALTLLLIIVSSLMYFCRTPCTTQSLFEYSNNHVVGNSNPDNRGLWRCLSHNAIGQIPGGINCRTRRRHVCLARWHLEFWICRSHAGISS